MVANSVDLSRAWAVLERGTEAVRAFPGAAAVIAKGFEVIGSKAVGRYSYEPWDREVRLFSLFDLASVSKTMVATGLMILVERGLVGLDDRIVSYLPRLSSNKANLTVRHLITHTSGLPSDPQLHESYPTKDQLMEAIYNVPLEYEPGSKVLYSSMGFQLLGEIMEVASSTSLDRLLNEIIFKPCQMADTRFLPPASIRHRILPTEFSRFRGRMLQGEVHDDNCYVVGGVAGHTGIFSTAVDVSLFGRMLTCGGVSIAGQQVLREETIEQMFSEQTSGLNERRSLGWTVNHEQFGHRWPPQVRCLGHTGFTGTSLCVLPEKAVSITLLTNRVNPTRDNDLITVVRPSFHEAVAGALFGDGA